MMMAVDDDMAEGHGRDVAGAALTAHDAKNQARRVAAMRQSRRARLLALLERHEIGRAHV